MTDEVYSWLRETKWRFWNRRYSHWLHKKQKCDKKMNRINAMMVKIEGGIAIVTRVGRKFIYEKKRGDK
jgi:hypothetical protein